MKINLKLDKWKIVAESDNFVIVESKTFKRIKGNDFLELVEEMKFCGYKPHLINYNWDGQILFEKEDR